MDSDRNGNLSVHQSRNRKICKQSKQFFFFFFFTFAKNFKIKVFKTIILLDVLNGCEALSLILRKKYRLRAYLIKQDPTANICAHEGCECGVDKDKAPQ